MEHDQQIKLPHDAFINPVDNRITISLGNVNLVFTLEEWAVFCEVIEDISVVLQTNLLEETSQCTACGHVDTSFIYEEPSEDEFN